MVCTIRLVGVNALCAWVIYISVDRVCRSRSRTVWVRHGNHYPPTSRELEVSGCCCCMRGGLASLRNINHLLPRGFRPLVRLCFGQGPSNTYLIPALPVVHISSGVLFSPHPWAICICVFNFLPTAMSLFTSVTSILVWNHLLGSKGISPSVDSRPVRAKRAASLPESLTKSSSGLKGSGRSYELIFEVPKGVLLLRDRRDSINVWFNWSKRSLVNGILRLVTASQCRGPRSQEADKRWLSYSRVWCPNTRLDNHDALRAKPTSLKDTFLH